MTARALPFDLLERAIDRTLDLDPETRDALAEFSGKVVDVEVAGAGAVRLRIDGGHVRVEPRDESRVVNVTIRGAPFSLLRFALAGDREALLLGGGVSLHGDVALAARLQRIAARMDLDLEEAFAQRIGDAPAHELFRAMRGLRGWARDAGASLLADASEYLRYETAMTPRREEAERFTHEVDDLRDGVERLEARILRLERRQAQRR